MGCRSLTHLCERHVVGFLLLNLIYVSTSYKQNYLECFKCVLRGLRSLLCLCLGCFVNYSSLVVMMMEGPKAVTDKVGRIPSKLYLTVNNIGQETTFTSSYTTSYTQHGSL
jgi:hypothetical protein